MCRKKHMQPSYCKILNRCQSATIGAVFHLRCTGVSIGLELLLGAASFDLTFLICLELLASAHLVAENPLIDSRWMQNFVAK